MTLVRNLMALFTGTCVFLLAEGSEISSRVLSELNFRNIGPAVTGGRIHDVEALPNNASVIYIGSASGGIWKSINKGTTWDAVFDDQPVSTFGDIAIAPSDPQIIYAGTGEQQNRQSSSWGNGVYRSDDGGEMWRHLGLEETRHTARVVVHPTNAEIVYVASPGNLWKGSEERGVFKSINGGRTWRKVLFKDTYTGAIDIVMDPTNPDVLYAAMYQRLRRTWGFNGGGPSSGIYKTSDGGRTWRELTNGIPEGDKGRIGLTISRSDGNRIYATIEHADESGFYRSDNGGRLWKKMNNLNPRPMYYSHIFVDPTNRDRVYMLATELYKTEDGGETFRQMPTRPTYDMGVHSDHHSLWIDPQNPDHLYLAGDAGLHESWDGGESFIRMNNIPIGQFYAIGVDMRQPYYVYGGMQDNHSWMGPSATRRWIGIINEDWEQIGFGDGMYQQPDPESHLYVYLNSQNGNLTRVDASTGDLLDIRPYPPAGEEPFRWDWVTPILLSQHNSSTVYFGGNRLFISKDRGESWTRTKDLSRAKDRNELSLMGVKGGEKFLSKNDGTSSYGEIVTIAESPRNRNVLWVGTDDGNVQVSKDGGKSWRNVSGNVQGVPDGTYVSRAVASVKDYKSAYVAFDAHRDGDFRPYVFVTRDLGETWRPITEGLPKDGSVNVIVEHPENPDLLFLGTEHALFVSTTGGDGWVEFESNLPTTLYDDLEIHPRDNDLIVGTHGRSFWILDDLTPLVEWSDDVEQSEVNLFTIRDATIFTFHKNTSYRGQAAYNGENPPFGALISYYLIEESELAEITIEDVSGNVVRRLEVPGSGGVIHRTAWDLRHEPPPFREENRSREGLIRSENILPKVPRTLDPVGPFVSPGRYIVRLSDGTHESVQKVRVHGDPEMDIKPWQWKKREQFLLQVSAMQSEVWTLSEEMKRFSDQLSEEKKQLGANASDEFLAEVDSAVALSSKTNRLMRQIYGLARSLNGQGVRQGSLYPPTETHLRRKEEMRSEMRRLKEATRKVI